jgi:hypothetical protein
MNIGTQWQTRPWPPLPAPVAAGASSQAALVLRELGSSPGVSVALSLQKSVTEYVSDSGMKWMRDSTKRQCDRALSSLRAAAGRGSGGSRVAAAQA